MAQQTISPPPLHFPLNTGDSAEWGDNPKTLIDKTNANFTEVYANVASLQAGAAIPAAIINTNAATADTVLNDVDVTGAIAAVDLAMTGTLGAGHNAQLPTVAAVLAKMSSPKVGSSYRLRITNRSSANFAWTITTNTGWTLTGTVTIAQNTWREFVVQITAVGGTPTATITSVAVGTYS